MNRWMPIAAGAVMVLAAFIIASAGSTQDTFARPEVARAIATALHETPTVTPGPPDTPEPTPTLFPLRNPYPSPAQIISYLFQREYEGRHLLARPENIRVEQVEAGGAHGALVVAGNGAATGAGLDLSPAAFGAVFQWDQGDYVPTFKHIEIGYRDAQVSLSVSPAGRVIFVFVNGLRFARGDSQEFIRTIVLQPCPGSPAAGTLHILNHTRQDTLQSGCY